MDELRNVNISSADSSSIEWSLLLNPTVAGAAFSYVTQPQSAIQIAKGVAANTVTGGYKISGGYAQTGAPSSGKLNAITRSINSVLRLGSTIAGVRDTIVLVVRPIAGSTNVDCEGCIAWHESI